MVSEECSLDSNFCVCVSVALLMFIFSVGCAFVFMTLKIRQERHNNTDGLASGSSNHARTHTHTRAPRQIRTHSETHYLTTFRQNGVSPILPIPLGLVCVCVRVAPLSVSISLSVEHITLLPWVITLRLHYKVSHSLMRCWCVFLSLSGCKTLQKSHNSVSPLGEGRISGPSFSKALKTASRPF